jgi:hypothetical protein
VKSDDGGGFLVRVARRFLPAESRVGSMAPDKMMEGRTVFGGKGRRLEHGGEGA